jgi:hypothetical protein
MTKLFGFTLFIAATVIYGQQSAPDSQSMHEQHMHEQQTTEKAMADHHEGVNSRGDQAMGFSHEKTTHHFLLRSNGGVIAIEVNDPMDTESRDEIRQHLMHIAGMFSAGDFEAPMFIHDRVPPGVPAMKRLQKQITYTFEILEHGAQIRIATKNSEAVKAVHDFLRFQITDHKTGDPLALEAGKAQ